MRRSAGDERSRRPLPSRAVRFLAGEFRLWRGELRHRGIRGATANRIKVNLGIASVSDRALRESRKQLDATKKAVAKLRKTASAEIEELRTAVTIAPQAAGPTALEQIWAASIWIEGAVLSKPPLISVVMPTRHRAASLARAVQSVRSQNYPAIELLVVDTGEDDAAGNAIAELDDPRVTLIRRPRASAAVARNAGISASNGRVIAYLDDDNEMLPGWLKGIAWAFDRFPASDVLYGARLIEDGSIVARADTPFPTIHFDPWDRARLEQANYIDMNTIAHRAGLAEGYFDEELESLIDWDMILRLTAEAHPLALPVVACRYTTSAPGRISDTADHAASYSRVRKKLWDHRPMRVLAYNLMFPLISETYIFEEIEALASCGTEVAYLRTGNVPSPMPVPREIYHDLNTALTSFRPDVLFLHWAVWAINQLPVLEQVGLPFAVRVHSFDFELDSVRVLMNHPLCVGVWGYPHHAELCPGMLPLPTFLGSAGAMPTSAEPRNLVLSVSAGLPKKDWPLLLGALEDLEGMDRRIVVAITDGHEGLPGELALRLSKMSDPPLLQVNLSRDQVFGLLARTAVLVYTLQEGQGFGNPISVVEGLCAGASVVLPDRSEARAFAGPGARFYRTREDIVDHVREVVAGGPAIDAERELNRDHGISAFADPQIAKTFNEELRLRIEAVSANRS